jgi:ABC-type Fe3+/spermidine/putrescine transport system ATPase subunit
VNVLLSIRDVSKSFGTQRVLRSVSLDVAAGEFLTVLGESGSGKTTLLRLIAGFEQLDSGEIAMEGQRLDRLPPYLRPVNTVFQQYALFPHMSVQDNVSYGLRIANVGKAEAQKRAEDALALVKMSQFANSSPTKLSGGQQQRVALARALVNRPKLLLLDEPLSALDANLRRQMQVELKALQREVGIAFILVTHDQEEAMSLSDRIALLRAGELEQVASPQEIYDRPATAYTASFIGNTNLIRAAVRAGEATAGSLRWKSSAADGPAIFSLRPECLRIAGATTANGAVRFRASVVSQLFQGATRVVRVCTPEGQEIEARIRSAAELPAECEFEFSPADALPVRDTAKRTSPGNH